MTETITENKPYDRQKLETDKEWYCFVQYRDLGIARSVNRTARYLEVDHSYIKGVSEKWNWIDRVYEWDLVVDRTKRTLILSNIEAMRDRHRELSQRIFRFSADQVEKYIRIFGREDMPAVKITDLVKLIDAATRLERSVYGEPDMTVAVKSDRKDMRELMEDQQALAVIDGLVERISPESSSD